MLTFSKLSDFFKPAFRREITITIIVKLILLTGLWYWFFSQPIDHKLTKQQLAQHFTA